MSGKRNPKEKESGSDRFWNCTLCTQLRITLLHSCFFPFPPPIRGKLEKERKEKTRQLGLIRTEGSDGGEDMERERRTFQLQMCEVGDLCQSKYQTQTPFTYPRWAGFSSHGWFSLWIPYFIHGQLHGQAFIPFLSLQ